jgi:hypothetical protein
MHPHAHTHILKHMAWSVMRRAVPSPCIVCGVPVLYFPFIAWKSLYVAPAHTRCTPTRWHAHALSTDCVLLTVRRGYELHVPFIPPPFLLSHTPTSSPSHHAVVMVRCRAPSFTLAPMQFEGELIVLACLRQAVSARVA